MNEQSVAPRTVDHRALLWLAEIARLGLNFSVLAVLARTVTPEVLGTYLSVTSLVLIVPRLLDCGLPHAFGYFLRLEPTQLRSASQVLMRHVALALPVAVAVAFGLRLIPFANGGVAFLIAKFWLQLALLMTSELCILLGLSAFVPTGRFRAYLLTVAMPPLMLLSGVLLAPHGALSAGILLDLLLASSVIGTCIMGGTLAAASARQPGAAFPVREAYGYGIRTYGSAVSKIAAQRFDRLYLVAVLGASAYAHYSLAISIRDMAIVPANLYAMTLRNKQIDLIALEDKLGEARRLLLKVSISWLSLGITGALVMMLVWEPLVKGLLGENFKETAEFLRVISFSCAPLAIMGYAWNHLYALRLPGRVTMITTGSLALAIPIFMACISASGLKRGIAMAVVLWAAIAAGASLVIALGGRPVQGTLG